MSSITKRTIIDISINEVFLIKIRIIRHFYPLTLIFSLLMKLKSYV
jgi:hypothetical protein